VAREPAANAVFYTCMSPPRRRFQVLIPADAMPRIEGTFTITTQAEPPFETSEGVVLGRMTFTKQFAGPLTASSTVWMTYARTPIEGSAGYGAIERVVGSLDGRTGSFILLHSGVMDRGASSLSVTVVPDSGTEQLTGLRGRMSIEVVEGEHRYGFEFELGS
jgi:hypothetical protein